MPATFRLQGLLVNLFTDYLPVHCQWVTLDKPALSYAIGPIPQGTNPLYFEVEYGRLSERFRFGKKHMPRRSSTKAVLASHRGIYDLFIPVRGAGVDNAGYILLGGFHLTLPTRDDLWARWCALRRTPGPQDEQEFLAFARTLLDVPVLTRSIVTELGQMLSATGPVLAGRGSIDAAVALIEKTKREVLGNQVPWRMWQYAEARRDRFHRGPFQGSELAPWDADEFKLKRGPDSVVAFVLRDVSSDPAEALCAAARLQWACFDYARQTGALVAGRLASEGALLLSVGARLQIRDVALQASQALSKRLGARVVASFRSYPKQPALVDRAILEVEGGLRLALARGQDLLEAEPLQSGRALSAGLEALSQRLAEALAAGHREEVRLLRDALGVEALRASAGRSELLRVHLRWCLGPQLKLLARRQTQEQQTTLARELDENLLGASSSHELLRLFSTLCDELALRLHAPAQGDLRVRLRRAAGRLQSQPEAETSLGALARDSGLSKFHFSRLFKKSTGLGFAKARLEARLAKARRLLMESDLSVAALAGDCGFRNAAHFSTVFKRSEGLSPLQFRNKKRK